MKLLAFLKARREGVWQGFLKVGVPTVLWQWRRNPWLGPPQMVSGPDHIGVGDLVDGLNTTLALKVTTSTLLH